MKRITPLLLLELPVAALRIFDGSMTRRKVPPLPDQRPYASHHIPRSAMRLVRLVLLVITAAMFATGCGDEVVDPSGSIFGTYALQAVDGQTVPYVVIVLESMDGTSTSTIELVGGSFALNSDNTWSLSRSIRTTTNGNVTTRTETEIGTFTTNNGSFQFMGEGGFTTPVFTGSVSGNTLTIVIRRPQPAVDTEDILVFTK